MPNALQVTQCGNGPAGQYSVNAAIPASSTTITFAQASSSVILNNLSSTTTIYMILGSGTATTGNFAISPLQSLNYSGPPITQITIIGSAASGNYAILAY
jgi:hypothetical protein